MPIAFGFRGWAAFKDLGQHTMIMGDQVLLQEEVNPVISALQANGLEITALHNHFFYEEPRVFFLHYWGTGSAENLALIVRSPFDEVRPRRGRARQKGVGRLNNVPKSSLVWGIWEYREDLKFKKYRAILPQSARVPSRKVRRGL